LGTAKFIGGSLARDCTDLSIDFGRRGVAA
jgi:hypothetical protein